MKDFKPLITCAALILTACGNAISPSEARITSTNNGAEVDFVSARPTRAQADLVIQNAQIVGDNLILDVTYPGGCLSHTLSLDVWEGFLESYPVQTYGALNDASGNRDRCKGILQQQVSVPLAQLAHRYQTFYGNNSGSIVLQLAGFGPITYSFEAL